MHLQALLTMTQTAIQVCHTLLLHPALHVDTATPTVNLLCVLQHAACGLCGLVLAMLLETVLLIIRSSHPPTLDKYKHLHQSKLATQRQKTLKLPEGTALHLKKEE